MAAVCHWWLAHQCLRLPRLQVRMPTLREGMARGDA